MQPKHQSSSGQKATTLAAESMQAARHLMAIRIVGTAIFDYQIRKTPDARVRLESVTTMAQLQGDLTAHEAALVSQLLGRRASDRSN